MKHEGFTPGPWRLDERDGGGYRITADEEHVSFVCSTRYVDRRRDKEAEANARLMADAPALLAERDAAIAHAADLLKALDIATNGAHHRGVPRYDLPRPRCSRRSES